jgi:RNA polymerase subunit RPABC4/transcription elongation factor Spt4
MDKDFVREVEMKGLLLGAELSAQKVHEEICPVCPFKTGFCEWRMKLALVDPELRFVCKGMRAWVTKSN